MAVSQSQKDKLVTFVNANTGLTRKELRAKTKQHGIVPGTMAGVVYACLADGSLSCRGFRPMRIFPAGQGDDVRAKRFAEERSNGKKVNGTSHAAVPSAVGAPDLLITIPVGNGESMTMTFTDAKRLRDQLVAAFR